MFVGTYREAGGGSGNTEWGTCREVESSEDGGEGARRSWRTHVCGYCLPGGLQWSGQSEKPTVSNKDVCSCHQNKYSNINCLKWFAWV